MIIPFRRSIQYPIPLFLVHWAVGSNVTSCWLRRAGGVMRVMTSGTMGKLGLLSLIDQVTLTHPTITTPHLPHSPRLPNTYSPHQLVISLFINLFIINVVAKLYILFFAVCNLHYPPPLPLLRCRDPFQPPDLHCILWLHWQNLHVT